LLTQACIPARSRLSVLKGVSIVRAWIKSLQNVGVLITMGNYLLRLLIFQRREFNVPSSECFDFWKNEAKPHLASDTNAVLNEFPGGYCCFASQWEGETTAPIVPLEKSQ
jgi:hypothetical protein